MAKRKRLTPARSGYLQSEAGPETLRAGGPMAPPIAQVAREVASTAALDELTAVVEQAREAGLLLQELPLEVIDAGHLVRDRLALDPDEMAALEASIAARGQQTPIEVTPLDTPQGGRTHGLISGWRRLMALRALHDRTGADRFATVRAVVVGAESAQDAYVAMVEENEIRVNLSLYERAHIALRAVEEGVFPTERAALRGLYGNATASKRSKIGSLLPVVQALGKALRFGPDIPEKLGLALSRELARTPGFGARVTRMLRETDGINSAADEMRLLSRAVARAAEARSGSEAGKTSGTESHTGSDEAHKAAARADLTRYDITGKLALIFHEEGDQCRIELRGAQITGRLRDDLRDWLMRRDNTRS